MLRPQRFGVKSKVDVQSATEKFSFHQLTGAALAYFSTIVESLPKGFTGASPPR